MNIKIALLSLIAVAPVAAAQRVQPEFAEVYCPEVPASVKLCGKTIDLDRTDMYERYDRELSSIVYTHGNTMLIIKRANRYFPEIAPILRANGVPEDLLYLACVESSLNPRAYSPAKAAGFWQFIPSAAKEYGLEVNGDWPSAMAAYNGGQARISRELDAQDADTSLDLYLAEETTRYPYRVMAMKTVLENPAKYGFRLRDNQLYQPHKYKTVEVSGPVEDWPTWAKEHGINYSMLREENPWIRAKKLTNKTGKTYKVRIPDAKSMSRRTAGTTTYNKAWTSGN